MSGAHNEMIATAAKAMLQPLGLRRKGRSRLWVGDHHHSMCGERYVCRSAVLAATILISAAAMGCAGHRLSASGCLTHDSKPWNKLEAAPPNAAAFRQLANANPVFPNSSPVGEEWFVSPGQVILCRQQVDSGGTAGEWWKFEVGNATSPQLVARDGWITTTHPIRGR